MFYVKPAIKYNTNTLVSALIQGPPASCLLFQKPRVKPNPSHLDFLFISALGGTEKVGFAFGQYTARIQAQFQLVLYRWAWAPTEVKPRSSIEPLIATSVQDTPCLNIYAPL